VAKSIHVFFTDRDEFFEFNIDTAANITDQLTNYIIEYYQDLLIYKILESKYNFIQKNEQMFIIGNIREELHADELYWAIYNQLLDYLANFNELNIEGFIRFRLYEYMGLLEDAVERGVNAYIIEIEYNQLIEYLTMYVELQQPMVHKVLITVQNNKYVVLDEGYQEILSLADFEDTMLDILITLAPEIIYIYNVREFNNKQLLKTISKIFKHRVCAFETQIPMPAFTGPESVQNRNPFQFTF